MLSSPTQGCGHPGPLLAETLQSGQRTSPHPAQRLHAFRTKTHQACRPSHDFQVDGIVVAQHPKAPPSAISKSAPCFSLRLCSRISMRFRRSRERAQESTSRLMHVCCVAAVGAALPPFQHPSRTPEHGVLGSLETTWDFDRSQHQPLGGHCVFSEEFRLQPLCRARQTRKHIGRWAAG